jgi:hypothetical protein
MQLLSGYLFSFKPSVSQRRLRLLIRIVIPEEAGLILFEALSPLSLILHSQKDCTARLYNRKHFDYQYGPY